MTKKGCEMKSRQCERICCKLNGEFHLIFTNVRVRPRVFLTPVPSTHQQFLPIVISESEFRCQSIPSKRAPVSPHFEVVASVSLLHNSTRDCDSDSDCNTTGSTVRRVIGVPVMRGAVLLPVVLGLAGCLAWSSCALADSQVRTNADGAPVTFIAVFFPVGKKLELDFSCVVYCTVG